MKIGFFNDYRLGVITTDGAGGGSIVDVTDAVSDIPRIGPHDLINGVIASWAYGLTRDTGRILLDMNPDQRLTDRLRTEIESGGDEITDLHIWRLGPGHLAAVVSVITKTGRQSADYHARLRHFSALSHVTVEVTTR